MGVFRNNFEVRRTAWYVCVRGDGGVGRLERV